MDPLLTLQQKSRLSPINILPFAIMGVGGFIRIFVYFLNRSLWLDEAMIALNIINRSYMQLTQQLNSDQSAPIGFLWIEKTALYFQGNRDLLLRFYPLFAGVAALWVMWKISQKFLKGFSPLIALSVFAVTDRLIYFSSEIKQYSSDVFVTVVLLLFTLACLDSYPRSKWQVILGICGTLGIWFSHPAVFILGGIGFTLLVDSILRKDKKGIFISLGMIAAWMISFGLEYIVSLRGISGNQHLAIYWKGYFMPLPPWSDPMWFVRSWIDLISYFGYKSTFFVITISSLILIGSISVLIRNWQRAALLLLPFIFVLAASGMGKYPFDRRLLLFLFPILILLLAEGIDLIRSLLAIKSKWLAWCSFALLIILVLYSPCQTAFNSVIHPIQRENIKALLTHLKSSWKDGDIVYVYHTSQNAFTYYADQYGFSKDMYFMGIKSIETPRKYLEDIDQLRNRSRVWFLFARVCSVCKEDEIPGLLKYLNKIGIEKEFYKSRDASLYLFDLSKNSP